MENVIVRFAPSPTGYLHIGGARTAIFNWLYARKHGGKFILRIEDTDAERSTSGSIQGIVDGLEWLGLDWDEGPNFQSRFVDDHRVAAQTLLDNGRAYKCFCTKEALDAKRLQAQQNKKTYQYDRTCRNLTSQEVADNETAGLAYTIRLKVPQGKGAVAFNDSVYGYIEKQYQDIDDFIIVRANGQPLYVLSNAVDDIRDGVTHVIRGQDGLANTPKQILIYQGLNAPLPRFAHMSLTLDPQKAKISKRKHGEQVAIHHYRKQGFLPWAMVNFLVLLGWATSDSQEMFDRQELIQAFNLEGIGRTNSVFNIKSGDSKFFTDPKLINMNANYLRNMTLEELLPFVKAQLELANLWKPSFEARQRDGFLQTIDLIRGRFSVLTDFITLGRAYFSDDFPMDEAAVRKNLKNESVANWLPVLAQHLEQMPSFDAKSLETELRKFLADHQIKTGQLINAVRTAVTGQAVGPEFVQVLFCMGRERVVDRLMRGVQYCSR